jgi:hypothetical protein
MTAALVGLGHRVQVAGEHDARAHRGRHHAIERELLEHLGDRDTEQGREPIAAAHHPLQVAAGHDRIELPTELGDRAAHRDVQPAHHRRTTASDVTRGIGARRYGDRR